PAMALGMDMLALTDSALARLCIGATRVDPRRRGRWLREIAARIDPPPNPRRAYPVADRAAWIISPARASCPWGYFQGIGPCSNSGGGPSAKAVALGPDRSTNSTKIVHPPPLDACSASTLFRNDRSASN